RIYFDRRRERFKRASRPSRETWSTGQSESEFDSVQHRPRPAVDAAIARSARKILVDLTRAWDCDDAAAGEGSRHRRSVWPVASADEKSRATFRLAPFLNASQRLALQFFCARSEAGV